MAVKWTLKQIHLSTMMKEHFYEEKNYASFPVNWISCSVFFLFKNYCDRMGQKKFDGFFYIHVVVAAVVAVE